MVLKQDDVAADITGYTWEVLEPSNSSGFSFEITDAANGVTYLNIDKDTTKDMRKAKQALRIRFIDAAGKAGAPSTITLDVK